MCYNEYGIRATFRDVTQYAVISYRSADIPNKQDKTESFLCEQSCRQPSPLTLPFYIPYQAKF